MLVEHVFVTTYEEDEALQRARQLLAYFGFRVTSSTSGKLVMTSGKKKPTSRKVADLPQTVQLNYDRGRVSVGAAIMARRNKDLPVHAELMSTLVTSLERLLVQREPFSSCTQQFLFLQAQTGKVWAKGEKVAIGCLIALIGAIVIFLTIG
ncbi:unnamed protein product, partial [marine sediment metagenome]